MRLCVRVWNPDIKNNDYKFGDNIIGLNIREMSRMDADRKKEFG